jgi:hypothetical protein
VPARGQEAETAEEDEPISRVGLADLPAYRAALSGRASAEGQIQDQGQTPPRVSFRDLWDHPEAWRGRRVRVVGRVARIFRQDAVGDFPPLAELWMNTPRGDLFCLAFPAEGTIPEPGSEVEFTGTFLRTIRYRAADQARLAPWVVGDRPPALVASGPSPEARRQASTEALRAVGGRTRDRPDAWTPAGWVLGVTVGLAAMVILLWQHGRRRRPHHPGLDRADRILQNAGEPVVPEPPLEFIDPETEPGRDESLHDAEPL